MTSKKTSIVVFVTWTVFCVAVYLWFFHLRHAHTPAKPSPAAAVQHQPTGTGATLSNNWLCDAEAPHYVEHPENEPHCKSLGAPAPPHTLDQSIDHLGQSVDHLGVVAKGFAFNVQRLHDEHRIQMTMDREEVKFLQQLEELNNPDVDVVLQPYLRRRQALASEYNAIASQKEPK
jgi:hypothetical protein